MAGGENLCPFASKGCREACLYNSGRALIFTRINQARVQKTLEFLHDKVAFVDKLKSDIVKHIRRSEKRNLIPVVRLNGTSDISWEILKGSNGKTIIDDFPELTFYDYTKNHVRMGRFLVGDFPKNYHLTFSKTEDNWETCRQVLNLGGNVAVVFRNPDKPATHEGYKVVNGDKHDLRFLEAVKVGGTAKNGVIVGLKAKAKAKNDTSGFVV